MIATLHMSTKRFIKYIILHKGGKTVSLITHHLYNNERLITVPVEKVSHIRKRIDLIYMFLSSNKLGQCYRMN